MERRPLCPVTVTPTRLLLALVLVILPFSPPSRAQQNDLSFQPDEDGPPVRNCTALISFREYLRENNSVSSVLPLWTREQNCCNWEAVQCGSGEVRQLQLRSYSLNGTIPPLSNLTTLTHLDLSGNNFTGDLPEGLHLLAQLQHLDLSRNILDGSIPSNLFANCPKLEVLNLEHNKLRQEIPHGLANCTELERFYVGNNNLGGSIPPDLFSVVSLVHIDLSVNDFDGSIPIELVTRRQLQYLDISFNRFSGPFPGQLFGAGELDRALASPTDLRMLDISRNNFSGPIPLQVFRSDNLTTLNLSSNAFDGILTEDVGNLLKLTALDVSHNRLSGEIPTSLGKCTQLEFLLLQGNRFNGTIPLSLQHLTELKHLDLSNNKLNGPVPTGGVFNDTTRFTFAGNNLCGGHEALGLSPCNPSGSGSGLPKVALAIIIAVAIGFFLLLLFWVFYRYRYFGREKSGGHFRHISFLKAPLRVTYADLHVATKGFSSANLVGLGSIGSVHRGFLEDERKAVAVKVFHKETVKDSSSFLEEFRAMKKITHSNLVKILATCTDKDANGYLIMALVYELMPNGNLEMWLHQEVVSQAISFKKWNLSLYQRLNLAIDVASALVHLHLGLERPIVHCNLKPSNILVAEDMTACVTDFGMNRIFAMNVIIANSNGYIAPECVMGGPISPLWDVYSFGILLLEMFTGKRPNENFGDGLDLHKYVQQRFPLDLDIMVDPLLLSEETGGKLTGRSRECFNSIIKIALTCSNEYPRDRMEIRDALEKLEEVKLHFLEVGGNAGMPPCNYFGPSASANPMLT